MKTNQFNNYSHDELESQKRVISTGYFIITAASFLAMAFFVTHNMIGTSKPLWDANSLQWGVGQLAYLLISIGFAFGFNAFTYFFYQMESNAKQRAFVLFVAVAFPMFAEIGQSMTRAEETRHEAATTSETFKTMQQRVAGTSIKVDAGATTALSDAMAAKAKAETELAACTRYTSAERRARCERIETGNINAAQAKVNAAQQIGQQVLSANQGQLDKDAATLKALEHDNDFLQPIVKLLMSFGIPAIGASFVIAFIIIGSMEVAMAYLGGLLRELKDRMRELGLAVSSNKVKARYADGVSYTRVPSSESAPASAFTSTANSAKQTVAEYAQKVEDGLKASPEIIATEYARAQHAREQSAAMVGDKLQAMGNKIEAAIKKPDSIQLDKPEIKPAAMKQSPEQLATVQRFYNEQMADYEAGKVFNDESPTPPIKRQSVAETIRALVDAVKKLGATSEADIQAAVFDAYSKLFNPADLDDGDLHKVAAKIAKATPATNERVHSANEQIIDERNERGANQHAHSPTFIPTNERVHSSNERTAPNERVHSTNERAHSHDAEKELLEAMKDAQGKIEADILKEGYGLYEQWKAAILSGETKLTTRDGRSFVNQQFPFNKK